MTLSPVSETAIVPPEDFWGRESNAQKFSFEFAPFGVPVEITANDPVALTAAQLSARRYSRSDQPGGQAIRLQIIARQGNAAPVPANLPEQLTYAGVGEWITLSAGEWGQAFGNLQTREGLISLSPTLAAESRLVSRYFIDHYILNFLFNDWAMLHASCVLDSKSERLIVLVGHHNMGKSTTALRLTREGYSFLADGMALLKVSNNRLVVGGYPIGEVKLRDDVLGMFPEYAGERVQVREHTKTVVDLRAVHPDRLAEALMTPSAIQLCFVERGPQTATHIRPIAVNEAFALVAPQTVFWNLPEALAHNTAVLNQLLHTASLYQLTIGSDVAQLVATLDTLS